MKADAIHHSSVASLLIQPARTELEQDKTRLADRIMKIKNVSDGGFNSEVQR
ncbi:hypothetical protein [Erwinia sp. V71]|uniref:hypothetical protein n=1 Tax=Erwinia sp. V71 TaxID=3369424 RepID=UPI003F62E509